MSDEKDHWPVWRIEGVRRIVAPIGRSLSEMKPDEIKRLDVYRVIGHIKALSLLHAVQQFLQEYPDHVLVEASERI